jgi:hypothetical protein
MLSIRFRRLVGRAVGRSISAQALDALTLGMTCSPTGYLGGAKEEYS